MLCGPNSKVIKKYSIFPNTEPFMTATKHLSLHMRQQRSAIKSKWVWLTQTIEDVSHLSQSRTAVFALDTKIPSSFAGSHADNTKHESNQSPQAYQQCQRGTHRGHTRTMPPTPTAYAQLGKQIMHKNKSYYWSKNSRGRFHKVEPCVPFLSPQFLVVARKKQK